MCQTAGSLHSRTPPDARQSPPADQVVHLGLTILALFTAGLSAARAQQDSLNSYDMQAIVVTESRAESVLASSTGSFSNLVIEDINGFALSNISQLLGTMPGLTFLDRDGEGNDPLAVVRGFYGGGEVEYLVVLVDGAPVNQINNGVVNWDALWTKNVQSIEFVRGGASALYGDAAIGGTLNIRTAQPVGRAIRVSAKAGSFEFVKAAAALHSDLNGRPFDASIDYMHTDGYRQNGARSTVTFNAGLALLDGRRHKLKVRTENHWRDVETPGYLPSEIVEDDPTQSLSAFMFDGTDENVHRLVADGYYRPGVNWELVYLLDGNYRNADIIGTLLLSPEFADTKLRELKTTRLTASSQLIRTWDSERMPGRVQIGFDLTRGTARSDYFNVVNDPQDIGSPVKPGGLDESGDSDRITAAGYIQLQLTPVKRFLVSIGGRFDHISDSFEPLAPGVVPASSTGHTAFSPKVGINYGYATGASGGNFYAGLSQSFKVPTLDQLYDQRTFPVPFEPYKISLSNAELEPQTGIQYEAGVYQRFALSRSASARLQLSIYRIDLINELDFSLQEFRYVNIGESRHDGVETGLRLSAGRASAFVSYAYQDASRTIGEYAGNQLKAVPKHIYSTGVQVGLLGGIRIGATLAGASGIYLDDASTIPLSGYIRVDGRVAYQFGSLTLSADLFNILDKRYSTTGFPDPSGSPVIYLYPAAGRRVQAGLSIQL